MSDSVDRVFVHALNTVKKIPRTGSARPPSSDRLKLYGLYKQSMEGDVAGVMVRPEGEGERERAEREKWDAWSAQDGLSRTEAKRRYISTLISTMHTYASSTPEARELVTELEFVWDQIRANEASSGSEGQHSSPGRGSGGRIDTGGVTNESRARMDTDDRERERQRMGSFTEERGEGGQRLSVLRPFNERDQDEEGDDGDKDAGDDARIGPDDENQLDRRRDDFDNRNRKWRRRMEQAMVKLTTEVAALREQIEARRSWSIGRDKRKGLWSWIMWFVPAVLRHVTIDLVVVGLVILWRWGRGDPRVREAVEELAERVKEIRTKGWKRKR
ncbi:hypothetical protein MMC30_001518 [Trapelia coarctata]|nr:hypothetical protein [Trapelia coarctata]